MSDSSDAALHERFEAIFEGIEAPFAFVDLDALAANADSMLARAAGKPIRVASKSVRCREVLTLVDERDERFRGLLCFTVAEALMLAEAGRRDLVVAYPSVDRRAISRLAELAHADPEAAPVLMVDEAAQLDLIEGCVGGGPTPIPVAIDIDVGYRALRGALQAGPKRSPIRTAAAARRFAEEIASRPGLELVGLMAYEGQIAGVGDAAPGRALRNFGIRRMQSSSLAEIRRAPGRDRRRGRRGRAASVRQRRRHRQPRADERRAGGHRAGGRLGLLRPRVVRRLQPLLAAPGRRLRPADRPPLVPRLRDRARRRLRRLGPGGRRPAAAAVAARRPPPRSP